VTDVLLLLTDDGGEIDLDAEGAIVTSETPYTFAFLCLFGGNERDDGRPDNPQTWWGNVEEADPARQYRSETQHLLRALPATSGNLRRLERAAERDLAPMVAAGVVRSVSASATTPSLNRVKLTVELEFENGDRDAFDFITDWEARR